MALATLSVLFVFRMPDVSRTFLLVLFPLQAAATIAGRVVLRLVMERQRRRGRNQRFVLVLGAGPRGQAFAGSSRSTASSASASRASSTTPTSFELPTGWRYLGSSTSSSDVLHSRVIDEVAICLPFSQWNLIDAIAQLCEEEGKIVRIPMDVLDRAFAAGRMEELDGTPVFSLVSGPDRALALGSKRLVDIVVSAARDRPAQPILLGIALAIRFDDGGPVLFRQRRVGLHGRPFDVIKFRRCARTPKQRRAELAHLNEVRGPVFKITNDPRITRVGRFLRRTSLDELPQLLNVLRGEMSLVGPRPPLPSEVEGYDLWHRRRLSMKPGITGLWQVRDRHAADFDPWVEADLEYIDRWSLWLDFKILFKTIPAALDGR